MFSIYTKPHRKNFQDDPIAWSKQGFQSFMIKCLFTIFIKIMGKLPHQFSNPVTGWFGWASKLRIFTPDRERVLKEETMCPVIASKVMFTPDSAIAYREAGTTAIGNLLATEFVKNGEESDDHTRNM